MKERLQKVLARAGLGSRRHCETLIRSGRVEVNGIGVTLGQKVDVEVDQIRIDGMILEKPASHRYIKFHKPSGYLTSTRSQGGQPTIYSLISVPERVFPVGRLDMPSEGLMLLTDDGDLANRLSHPRYQHEKEYRVLFKEIPDQSQVRLWETGVQLPDGYLTQPSPIQFEQLEEDHAWYRVILREGRKRQIRTMASVLGLTVLRLIRVRISSLELGDLECGSWRDCTDGEIQALRLATGRLDGEAA
jgi:23S rRNA pseudouridine2605 synthase